MRQPPAPSELITAATAGDEAKVQELLRGGLFRKVANVNGVDEAGWTALQAAAHAGQVGTVQVLLQAGATVDAVNQNWWTALHYGTKRGSYSVVHALLQGGANPKATTKQGYVPRDYVVDHKKLNELLVNAEFRWSAPTAAVDAEPSTPKRLQEPQVGGLRTPWSTPCKLIIPRLAAPRDLPEKVASSTEENP
eukprot:gene28805-35768_t